MRVRPNGRAAAADSGDFVPGHRTPPTPHEVVGEPSMVAPAVMRWEHC